MSSSPVKGALRFAALVAVCVMAYRIRLNAIEEYGMVIHEFDPWFNFRATQYLADNGLAKFFKWYDYMSWYPLGRPVGTTIYPGMQMTSVAIWNTLNAFGVEISLNDVCVYVPAWFGVSATLFLGLLARECSGSDNAGLAAATIMSIIPAHIMRSVGGGYDNESIAMTAMCATFFWWVRSLRNKQSWWAGAMTGLSYVYMVAAWGGYVFVVNMIALHAFALVATGRYTKGLHRSYTLFYIIGTAGAIQIPVVGWTPLKSLEQMAPLGVFFGLHLWEISEILLKGKKDEKTKVEILLFRFKVFAVAAGVASIGAVYLLQTGYFGPISSRVRGLFVKHTRTGNPLVDSVAEHQPADSKAYWTYLYSMCYIAPIGLAISCYKLTDAKVFIILYGLIAYYFSAKMNRLVILLGPVASSLGGVAVCRLLEWSASQLELEEEEVDEDADEAPKADKKADAKKGKGTKNATKKKARKANADTLAGTFDIFQELYDENKPARKIVAVFVVIMLVYIGMHFNAYCWATAKHFSHPQLMYKARLGDQVVMIDDYREAYWYLRDKTPEDSRVMAWWDYGYQITGIGNRTTIADGNTWNHEHIATLGYMLTSPEKRAHKYIRHMADYVLVWAGGGSDDMAKSPHLARIANSVYDDVCPNDPMCRSYGWKDTQRSEPTPMMEKSLLYKLVQHEQRPGVTVDETLFKEVYTSKYRKVRIYKVMKVSKTSKEWNANPENRVCDAPGSWYCAGQYPPGMDSLIERRRDFAQLEDFNAAKDSTAAKKAQEYQRQYHGGGR